MCSKKMNSRHHFVSEDGSVSVPSIPMAALTKGDEDEYFERITRALKEYRWRDEDFLLATYPKSGNRHTLFIYWLAHIGSMN